ncbi:hypothetical protein Q7P37_003695 [Cladosporium fusiforme]
MMETRSQRRQAYNQRPSYPQISSDISPTSATSSAFNSSSSLNSVSSTGASSLAPSTTGMPQQTFASAPLPSPSNTQRQNYFGTLSTPAPTSHPEQMPTGPRCSVSEQYNGQRGDGGGAPATTPFLQDFNLVAEAAKRAQMACLMRDMGDVEL